MLRTLLIIISGILSFNFLVVAHEFGHFFYARRYGMPIEEFSIGFPPRIYKRKTKAGYDFSIGLLPLGGYVKITGEELNETIKNDKKVFANQSFSRQLIVLVSGVTINILISFILIAVLLTIGMPKLSDTQLTKKLTIFNKEYSLIREAAEPGLKIDYVVKDSVAAKQGITVGEQILSINNINIETFEQLKNIISTTKAGQILSIKIVKNGDILTKDIIWESDNGKLGISGSRDEKYFFDNKLLAPVTTVITGSKWIVATVGGFFSTIAKLVTKAEVAEQVAGPIGIANVYYQASLISPKLSILLIALISLSLGTINLLPLPALDGGRIFILILKKLGLKLSPKLETIWHTAGFAFLIILILIISAKDIIKL